MKQLKKRDLLKVKFTEEVVKELLPEWSDARNMEIVVLEGGITNKLYRIKSDKGDVAVRIYGDRTEMFINRDWEAEAIEKMAAEQISPKLVKYIPEQKVTIVEFVTGCYTLKNPDFLKTELHELIVDPIRRIHRSKARLSKLFDPPVEVEKMASDSGKGRGGQLPGVRHRRHPAQVPQAGRAHRHPQERVHRQPQRPAGREFPAGPGSLQGPLPPPAVHHRLGIRRHGSPLLRPGGHVPGSAGPPGGGAGDRRALLRRAVPATTPCA